MFSSLTYNKKPYAYCHVTLSYYMYLYKTFLSGASTTFSPTKGSHLPSLLFQLFSSILCSRTLHTIMKRYERLQHTPRSLYRIRLLGSTRFRQFSFFFTQFSVQPRSTHPFFIVHRCLRSLKAKTHEFLPRRLSLSLGSLSRR